MSEPTSMGQRLGDCEVELGRHDERVKSLEVWVPRLQEALEGIYKSLYWLAGAFAVISVVIQVAFKFWRP